MSGSVYYGVRIWESGSLTGTDPTYTLPGTANAGGFRTFSGASVPTGSLVYLMLVNTSTNAWEYSTWTYTSGSPGTIARVTFLESSTGSIINWSGVTATIGIEIPPPTNVSSGSSSQGLIPALASTGTLDPSLVSTGYSFPPFYPGKLGYLGIGDGFSRNLYGNNSGQVPSNNQVALTPFKWSGNFPIKSITINVTTAGTPVSPSTKCLVRLGFYTISSAGTTLTLLWEPTATTQFNTAATGLVTLVSGTDFPEYFLPPGIYIMGMQSCDATASTASLSAYSTNYQTDLGGMLGFETIDFPNSSILSFPLNTTPVASNLTTPITSSNVFGNSIGGQFNTRIIVYMGAQ